MQRASFHSMEEGTAEDWAIIEAAETRNAEGLVDRVLAQLQRLVEGEQPFAITRYEHSLQSATRALRDGADEEMVVAALLHDIGDEMAPLNHAQYAAAVLRPYVSERTHWIVAHHDVFQGYYFWHHIGAPKNARDAYRDHPHFDACAAFCADWDQNAFAPGYASEPLSTFEPMVRRIFARKPYGDHTA
jgi:predicted HD phosphohydrolase